MRSPKRADGWRLVIAFYALTFVLLASIPLLQAVFFGTPMDFDAAAARASAERGIAWTSNLWSVLQLARSEPVLLLLVLGSAVPSIAAVVACLLLARERLRPLLARFALRISMRDAITTNAALFAVMSVGLLGVYALRSAIPGSPYDGPTDLTLGGALVALLSAAVLDQGAVLEELGWRGFAQPELQRLVSPLAAAVLVGIGWGLWHLPRDVVAGVIERLGFVEYALLFLPSFVGGCVALSIIAAYFVNRCGGSVIPAIFIHGIGNDAAGLSGTAAMEIVLSPLHQATKALPFLLIAAVLVAFSGRSLGRAASPTRETV